MESYPSSGKRPRYGHSSLTGRLTRFENAAGISDFDPTTWVLAPSYANFNDALRIPHYERNAHSISGENVADLRKPSGPCPHIASMSNGRPVYAAFKFTSPLTGDLGIALRLVAFTPDNIPLGFWQEQMAAFRYLAGLAKPNSQERGGGAPAPIIPVVDLIKVALFAHPLYLF